MAFAGLRPTRVGLLVALLPALLTLDAIAAARPLLAQSSGDILPPQQAERPQPRRSAPLRPSIDGREPTDRNESTLRPAVRAGEIAPARQPAPREGGIARLPGPAPSSEPDTLLRDGIVDVTEAPLPPGPAGIDTVGVDARSAADSAPFDLPSADSNAELFQVEDIEPLTDRRVTKFFQLEPYQAVGFRLGSFVLFPQAELVGVGFSNVQRGPRARADAALEVKPEARLVSNWRWHALELKAAGNLSFHDQLPSENDRGYLLEARGRIDVARNTDIQALASREVASESRSGVDAVTGGDRADITTSKLAASLNHRFNRVSVQLRGGVTDVAYGEVADETNGPVDTQRDRNFVQTDEGVRVRYDLKPGIGVFGDVTLVQRSFDAPAADGLRRDSDGERYRVGLAFLPTHPRLRGEISVGFGRQRPDERALTTVDGLLIDSNLVWRMTPLTSLLFNARSDIVDSSTPGVGGVMSRTLGLEARHLLRRYLTLAAGVQATRNSYRGSDLEERETTARLALEYAISREILLFSRYDHIWFDSSERGGDWQADEVRVGMRIRH